MVTVPRVFPNSTIVCIGGGPSLTAADVDACRGRARVVAVNDAHRLAPWADVLYACDGAWWDHYQGVPTFAGSKYCLTVTNTKWREGDQWVRGRRRWPGVEQLQKTGEHGLEVQPHGVRTGMNSGYQAINVAVHLGAVRIVLLGYDMQRGPKRERHWFGEHPKPLAHDSPYGGFVNCFQTLVAPLRAIRVEVVNASRETALRCFPRQSIEQALARTEAAACGA